MVIFKSNSNSNTLPLITLMNADQKTIGPRIHANERESKEEIAKIAVIARIERATGKKPLNHRGHRGYGGKAKDKL